MKELFDACYEIYKQRGDSMFLDNYKLGRGIYIKVTKEGKIDRDSILYIDNKNKENLNSNNELYRWYVERDFYSFILDANKYIDLPGKKFHSNNYFTMFLKRSNLPDNFEKKMKEKNKNITFDDVYRDYESKLIERIKKYGNDENIISEAKEKMSIFNKLWPEVISICNEYEIKISEGTNDTEVKLYIDEELNRVKEIAEKYYFLTDTIFLNSTDVFVKDGVLYGVPNFSTTLNDKKPFIKLKNMPFKGIEYPVSLEYAYFIQKLKTLFLDQHNGFLLSDFMYEKFKTNVTNDVYIKFNIDKTDIQIDQYEVLGNIDKSDKVLFTDYNIARLSNPEDIDINGNSKLIERNKIAGYLNHLFLQGIFFDIINSSNLSDLNKNNKIKDNSISKDLKNAVYLSKDNLIGYFNMYKKINLYNVIDKITKQAIKDKILRSNLLELKYPKNKDDVSILTMLDYRISLLNTFNNGEGRQMAETYAYVTNDIKTKLLNEKEYHIDSDQEFYFIAGQLAYYLATQSQGANKTGRLLDSCYKAKTGEELKNAIVRLFHKYRHAIVLTNLSNFSKLYSAFLNYTPDSDFKDKTNTILFELGLFSDNSIYLKTKREDKEDSNQN